MVGKWHVCQRCEDFSQVFVEKTERTSLFDKLLRRRWKRNVRVDFTGIRRVDAGWSHVSQVTNH
jgi:hypothetical protein